MTVPILNTAVGIQKQNKGLTSRGPFMLKFLLPGLYLCPKARITPRPASKIVRQAELELAPHLNRKSPQGSCNLKRSRTITAFI